MHHVYSPARSLLPPSLFGVTWVARLQAPPVVGGYVSQAAKDLKLDRIARLAQELCKRTHHARCNCGPCRGLLWVSKASAKGPNRIQELRLV